MSIFMVTLYHLHIRPSLHIIIAVIVLIALNVAKDVVFTARRYASEVQIIRCGPVCLSVCHKPVLYQNG